MQWGQFDKDPAAHAAKKARDNARYQSKKANCAEPDFAQSPFSPADSTSAESPAVEPEPAPTTPPVPYGELLEAGRGFRAGVQRCSTIRRLS